MFTAESAESAEMTERENLNRITKSIIGTAIEVHRALGPGPLESAYQACLTFERAERGLKVERQKPLPVIYRGVIASVAKQSPAFKYDQLGDCFVAAAPRNDELSSCLR